MNTISILINQESVLETVLIDYIVLVGSTSMKSLLGTFWLDTIESENQDLPRSVFILVLLKRLYLGKINDHIIVLPKRLIFTINALIKRPFNSIEFTV